MLSVEFERARGARFCLCGEADGVFEFAPRRGGHACERGAACVCGPFLAGGRRCCHFVEKNIRKNAVFELFSEQNRQQPARCLKLATSGFQRSCKTWLVSMAQRRGGAGRREQKRHSRHGLETPPAAPNRREDPTEPPLWFSRGQARTSSPEGSNFQNQGSYFQNEERVIRISPTISGGGRTHLAPRALPRDRRESAPSSTARTNRRRPRRNPEGGGWRMLLFLFFLIYFFP